MTKKKFNVQCIWEPKWKTHSIYLNQTFTSEAEKTFIFFLTPKYPKLYSVKGEEVEAMCSYKTVGKFKLYEVPLEMLKEEGEVEKYEFLVKKKEEEQKKFDAWKKKKKDEDNVPF